MNSASVTQAQMRVLIERFHPDLRPKLRNFTGWELFCAHRLIATHRRDNDHFWHGLRSALVQFLRAKDPSNANPLSIDQWAAVGADWVEDWSAFLQAPTPADADMILKLRTYVRDHSLDRMPSGITPWLVQTKGER